MTKIIIAALAALALSQPIQAQCYSRSHAGYNYSQGYSSNYCAPTTTYVTPVYAAPVSYLPPLAVTYNIALPQYAVTGSTSWGYGHPVATGLDPASLLNSAGRYLQLSTDAASQGFQQYNQSANVINAGNRKEMEAQIRQQLAQQILGNAGQAQPGQSQPGQTPPLQQPGAETPPAAAPKQQASATPTPEGDAAAPPGNLQDVADGKCIRCHGGTRKEKNLDLRDLSKLSADMVRTVLKKIMSDDPNERMPPVKEPPLTVEEKIAFIAGAIGPSEKSKDGSAKDSGPGPQKPAEPTVPARPPAQTTPKLPVPKG